MFRLLRSLAGTVSLLLLLAGCGGSQTPGSPVTTHPSVTPSALTSPSPSAQVYVVAASGTLTVYAGSSGKTRWQFQPPAPQQVNVVAVGNGIAYAGTDEMLYALDAASGRQLWQAQAGPAIQTLSVTADVVYVGSAGQVYALGAHDGAIHWQRQLGQQQIPFLVVDAASSTLYAPVQNLLAAVNLADGTVRWQVTLAAADAVQQVVPADATVLIRSQNTLQAVQAADGSPLWQRQTGVVSLVVQGQTVSTVFRDGPPDGTAGVVTSGIRALSLRDGTLLWEVKTPLADENEQDALSADRLYRLTTPGSGALSAWRPGDGAVLWQTTLGQAVADLLATPAALYVAEGTALGALDPATGAQRWRMLTPAGASSLAFTDGILFAYDGLFDSGLLLALDVAQGGQFAWQLTLSESFLQILVA